MSEPPILIVPYMWIGDFVRCHTVVKLLKQRFPARAIDVLTTSMVAPLLDYMPGVRKGIVADLPRNRLALTEHRALADRLRTEGYGQALVMPRTWKSALAPLLASIPRRTGFIGEARFGLINDLRFGERRLPRMTDRCATLALRKDEPAPAEWPLPELKVPPSELAAWGAAPRARSRRPSGGGARAGRGRAVQALAQRHYASLARRLAAEGNRIWVIGGPGERELAAEIVRSRRLPHPRPHRRRPAQCHSRARRGRGRGLERLRSPPRRRGARHPGGGNFRSDQPVALGSAQSDRRGDRNRERAAALPALPLAGPPSRMRRFIAACA